MARRRRAPTERLRRIPLVDLVRSPAGAARVAAPPAGHAGTWRRALLYGRASAELLASDSPGVSLAHGEWYIDLTALWDPTDRGRAEETLARWRRRNLPAVAYFGIRRVGEEGYARGARPERFAKREAVNAHETGPALARREWAPAEADWGIEE